MPEDFETEELALLVKRLDRQRRARLAAESISEQATRALYDKQQHLMLLQSIAVAANEASSFLDAVQTAVDQICSQLGWPVGHAYLPLGNSEILSLTDVWTLENLQRYEPFRQFLEQTRFSPERGLPGRAVQKRKTVWTAELSAAFTEEVVDAAQRAGIRSALALPIVAGDETAAVLEFFSDALIDPEPALVEILDRIGALLGQRHVRATAEITLRNSEEQYRLLFEANPHPMWVYDVESLAFLAVNNAAVENYGYTRDEFLAMTLREIRIDDEKEEGNLRRHRHKDGAIITVETTSQEVKLPGRRARLVMAVDITDRRHTEDALRESERRFRDLLDTIQLCAVLRDVVGTVTYCNPYFLSLTGYAKHEAVGGNWFDLFVFPARREEMRTQFAERIARGRLTPHEEGEIVTRRGERRVIAWSHTILRNAQGSVLGSASIGSDVTEQRRAEKQLLHDAFHDALTGLPNRALFLDRVSHAMARTRRNPTHSFAVLLLDIDRFKVVNDSLGHTVGDHLLVELGRRLQAALRVGDTVARIGGDEFTVMVESIADLADATRTADRILQNVAAPFFVDGDEIFTSVSIGITLANADYDQPEQMIRDADTAMYRAKSEGKSRYELFDARMRAEAVALLQVETDLRRALDRGELRVHYQPILELDSGRVAGFEALLRWQHPVKGLVSPAQFIPVAEENGLIVPIGRHVLRESCRQLAEWKSRNGYGTGLSVNVNISSRQFSQSDLVREVESALRDHSLDGADLTLEITESVLIQHADTALETIRRLRALGVRIAIDDFGTGFSSLSYLHRFPTDKLKIDLSFVASLDRDQKNVEIVRAIIALAQSLGMQAVAEGIETEEQRAQLRAFGCGFGQGFLFSRAVDAERAAQLLL